MFFFKKKQKFKFLFERNQPKEKVQKVLILSIIFITLQNIGYNFTIFNILKIF